MKNGKAAGPGNISIKLTNTNRGVLREMLGVLFNKMLIEGEAIPQDLNISLISSLYKKRGKQDCNNYRGE